MDEGKKKAAAGASSSRSIADELFGRNDKPDANNNKLSSTSPASGYFSSIFPPASAVMAKQRSEGPNGKAPAAFGEGKQQGNGSRSQSTHNKDGKPNYETGAAESPYFGSSVYYGGRDFYTSPNSNSNNYQSNNEDDPNFATRGDWWQGSLYY